MAGPVPPFVPPLASASVPPFVPPAAPAAAPAHPLVPFPRRSPEPESAENPGTAGNPGGTESTEAAEPSENAENAENTGLTGAGIRGWYENELGWPTVPGEPVRLLTGERFDVLDVPVAAGHAALPRLAAAGTRAGRAKSGGGLVTAPGFPVAVRGGRMWLLVAAGAAEELPGILQWLEWGSLPLDLTAVGAGGLVEAPLPADRHRAGALQGAAVWVRPPVAGCEAETSLPTLSASGAVGGAPDLVRLVNTLATECHRVRLGRASAQPLAFS